LYDELTQKHEQGIFARRPNPVAEILKNGKERFVALEVERQIYVLTQILNLSLICNSASADLQEIGGSSKTGVTLISKKLSGYSEAKLIHCSPTGMFTKEVDLLTV
jgi:CRISPR-associated endonuclease Csn1